MHDLLGTLVIAVLLAIFVRLAAGAAEWMGLYFVALAILAPTAWFMWRDPKYPASASGWLLLAAGALVLGFLSFLVDVSIGHSKNPAASAWEAAQLTGSMFGFAFTATVFPALFLISAGGATRSAYGRWRSKA
jgi:hypothetical protein